MLKSKHLPPVFNILIQRLLLLLLLPTLGRFMETVNQDVGLHFTHIPDETHTLHMQRKFDCSQVVSLKKWGGRVNSTFRLESSFLFTAIGVMIYSVCVCVCTWVSSSNHHIVYLQCNQPIYDHIDSLNSEADWSQQDRGGVAHMAIKFIIIVN